jgi:hypothetical protein
MKKNDFFNGGKWPTQVPTRTSAFMHYGLGEKKRMEFASPRPEESGVVRQMRDAEQMNRRDDHYHDEQD